MLISPQTQFRACDQRYHAVNREHTIGGNITVQLTYCLIGLDLTKQVKLFLIQHKQSSRIHTK